MVKKFEKGRNIRSLILMLLMIVLLIFALVISQKNTVFNSNSKAREVEFCGTAICKRGYQCIKIGGINKCIKDILPSPSSGPRDKFPTVVPTNPVIVCTGAVGACSNWGSKYLCIKGYCRDAVTFIPGQSATCNLASDDERYCIREYTNERVVCKHIPGLPASNTLGYCSKKD
ncbi:MAG: hypothetical protein WC741_00660 [Patescibacteria group bacterium]|jgi:hypothetical protein